MKKLIVYILAIITALESLSIDMYLPAFAKISETFSTLIGNVQISLSLFLAGFAIGQLFWGPLSDKHGRKPVLVTGLAIFIVSTIAIHFVNYIEVFWLCRFLQAFGGCAGIVMSRAIVADMYTKEETLKIFSTQTQISGIAPIIAPLLGSLLLASLGWRSIFTTLALLGSMCLLAVILWVPESRVKREEEKTDISTLVKDIFSNRQFLIYTFIGAMAYSALMLYISSAPFILIQKAGMTESQFSIAFGFNSLALIIASFITPKLSQYFRQQVLVVIAAVFLTLTCIGFGCFTESAKGMVIFLFLSLIPTGILFPVTTSLALSSISDGKGTAAAILGCIQLTMSFVLSALSGLMQHDSMVPMVILRIAIGLVAIGFALYGAKWYLCALTGKTR